MKFVVSTALASALTFGGVWFAHEPGSPAAASTPAPRPASITETAKAPSQPVATVRLASIHYAGCDEVRALGKAPLYAHEPGYREGMDGDGDGIACEPIR